MVEDDVKEKIQKINENIDNLHIYPPKKIKKIKRENCMEIIIAMDNIDGTDIKIDQIIKETDKNKSSVYSKLKKLEEMGICELENEVVHFEESNISFMIH